MLCAGESAQKERPELVASARAHVAVELFFGALKRSSPHQRGGFHQKKKAQGNAGGSGQSLNAANEKPTFERRERWDTRGGLILCPEANMSNEEELVVFMTLPFGVDESIIPGVLASRGIPFHLSERYLARQGRYVEIQVPASRLEDARRALGDAKRVVEQLEAGNES